MKTKEISAEMAIRKIQFHKDEDWDKINLWGLFGWGDVKPLLASGKLLTHMEARNVTIWVTPSKEFWENEIESLTKKHSLDELKRLAGW